VKILERQEEERGKRNSTMKKKVSGA